MTGRDCDIAIVGGGLAGGLIALALARLTPELAVQVLESGPAAGGNHRWSWFDSDLSDDARSLLGYDPEGARRSNTWRVPLPPPSSSSGTVRLRWSPRCRSAAVTSSSWRRASGARTTRTSEARSATAVSVPRREAPGKC